MVYQSRHRNAHRNTALKKRIFLFALRHHQHREIQKTHHIAQNGVIASEHRGVAAFRNRGILQNDARFAQKQKQQAINLFEIGISNIHIL